MKAERYSRKVWRAPLPQNEGIGFDGNDGCREQWKTQSALGYWLRHRANKSGRKCHCAIIEVARVRHRPRHVPQRNREAIWVDVFFPVASSFERGGTFMNSERRIQRVRKAIEAAGRSKSRLGNYLRARWRDGQRRLFQFSIAGRNLGRNPQRLESRSRYHICAVGKAVVCNGPARQRTTLAPQCCTRNLFRAVSARH